MSPLLTSHFSVTSKVFTKCSHPCPRCQYTMLWQACREQIWLYRVLLKIHYARYKSLKSCTTSQFVKNIISTFAKKRFRCKAGNDKKKGGWLSQVTIARYCSEKLNQFTLSCWWYRGKKCESLIRVQERWTQLCDNRGQGRMGLVTIFCTS